MAFMRFFCTLWMLLWLGCGPSAVDSSALSQERVDYRLYPYAQAVVEFNPGPESGFGQELFPEIVLGPPQGFGPAHGSVDVLSLGVAGEIILDFFPREMIDGEGADFAVFENVFWPGNDSSNPWKELAEVSVSDDGENWHTFTCVQENSTTGEWPGCAGWRPTHSYAPQTDSLDPDVSGGDLFDLADLGLTHARYVKIRDLAQDGAAPSAGFDLDAVGLISFTEIVKEEIL